MMSECTRQGGLPEEVEQLLKGCEHLPSLPAVVVKIIDASKDPDISLSDLADILYIDPALSAKLLRMANSPMYARQREITNLQDALSLLGLNASLTISLSFSLVSSLNSNPDTGRSFDDFWKRAILAATIARQIGLKLKQNNLEEFFLASLLQDIGILAIDSATSDLFAGECNNSHFTRVRCEMDRWGVDHADIGAWLLQSWSFPEKIYRAVLCSHANYTQKTRSFEEETFLQCIWIAGKLSDIWLGDNRERIIDQNLEAMNSLLGFTKDDMVVFLGEVDALLPDMASMFDINLFDTQERETVLCEAREILTAQNLNLIKKFDDHQNQIRSLIEKTQSIEEEANKDYLTNTFNRKRIESLLDIEFKLSKERQKPLSLVFIDIDDFKPINDTYGHLAGDKVLQDIAKFFSRQIRRQDIIARYGGDEFLLLLPGTSEAAADILMQRIMVVAQKVPGTQYNGMELKVSTSIGVATYSADNSSINSPEELVNAADKALYHSKQAGKNTVTHFSKDLV